MKLAKSTLQAVFTPEFMPGLPSYRYDWEAMTVIAAMTVTADDCNCHVASLSPVTKCRQPAATHSQFIAGCVNDSVNIAFPLISITQAPVRGH